MLIKHIPSQLIWSYGLLWAPLGCHYLFLPPSIIHSKTAMSQKRTDMEEKKGAEG